MDTDEHGFNNKNYRLKWIHQRQCTSSVPICVHLWPIAAASQIGVRFGGRLEHRLDKAADFLKIVKVAVTLVGEMDDVAAPDGGLTGGGHVLPP